MMQIVETQPQSPFEALWRLFPQLHNATCVYRIGYAGEKHGGVIRTFRLLDGTYLRIHSWGLDDGTNGNDIETIPSDEIAIFEGTWRAMAGRLYDAPDPDDEEEPHGMRFASHKYFELVEDQLDGFEMEALEE